VIAVVACCAGVGASAYFVAKHHGKGSPNATALDVFTPEPGSNPPLSRAIALPPEPAATLLRLPDGRAPEQGWPVVIALHGYGASGPRFTGFADWFTRHGFAVVVPSGPSVLGSDRYAWPDLATTGPYVDRALEATEPSAPLDRDCPLVAGFSQGAMRAIELALREESGVCGVLAVSPVGRVPGVTGTRRGRVPAFIVVGKGDATALETARNTEQAWRAASWPVRVVTHPGGHAPPSDWPGVLDQAVEFLR
jgi:predicted esterase